MKTRFLTIPYGYNTNLKDKNFKKNISSLNSITLNDKPKDSIAFKGINLGELPPSVRKNVFDLLNSTLIALKKGLEEQRKIFVKESDTLINNLPNAVQKEGKEARSDLYLNPIDEATSTIRKTLDDLNFKIRGTFETAKPEHRLSYLGTSKANFPGYIERTGYSFKKSDDENWLLTMISDDKDNTYFDIGKLKSDSKLSLKNLIAKGTPTEVLSQKLGSISGCEEAREYMYGIGMHISDSIIVPNISIQDFQKNIIKKLQNKAQKINEFVF